MGTPQIWEGIDVEESRSGPAWLQLTANADQVGLAFEREFEELSEAGRALSLSELGAKMGNLSAVRAVVAHLHKEAETLRMYVQYGLQNSPVALLPLFGVDALPAGGAGVPLAFFLLQAEAWLLATVLTVEADKKRSQNHESQDQENEVLRAAVATLKRSHRLSNIREKTRALPDLPAIDLD
jgi:hypothetical protein